MMKNTADFNSTFRDVLQQIYEDFCNQEGLFDLIQAEKILKENKVQSSRLFEIKIKKALKDYPKKTMNPQQFIDFFSKNDDEVHLSAIFDLIDQDKSQNISRSQLAALNQKYQIGLSRSDIDAMINQISSDGQKVTKSELIKFLSEKN